MIPCFKVPKLKQIPIPLVLQQRTFPDSVRTFRLTASAT